jgi:nucleoside-diphosphate-sugar epimerase
MGKKLVIGSSGQIGTELILDLVDTYGASNVIATDIKATPPEVIKDVTFFSLDVLDKDNLFKLVKDNNIDEIYLLAALLSAIAEQKVQQAWNLNMKGLFNVLDLAKERHIKKVFWPSSIAIFGATSPKIMTPQRTITEPSTVYGISKLAGERWCEYYHNNYGVDVRSIRYPGLISYKSEPGGGTTDYAVDIFHQAINKGKYSSFLGEDVRLPMMYMDDAIRATRELMHAEESNITIRSSYNVSGMSFTPYEIGLEVKKHLPNFKLEFKPDFRNKIALTWPESIDDSFANNDWKWTPKFDLETTSTIMIKEISKQNTVK